MCRQPKASLAHCVAVASLIAAVLAAGLALPAASQSAVPIWSRASADRSSCH